jgi:hypothetical protein
MAYVPVIVAAAQPSARAKELAKAITFLIEGYQRKDSKVSDLDVNQALQLVQAARKRGSTSKISSQVVIALILVGLGVFFALLYNFGFIF